MIKKRENTIRDRMEEGKWSMGSTLPHERTPQAPISNGPEHALNQAGEGRMR